MTFWKTYLPKLQLHPTLERKQLSWRIGPRFLLSSSAISHLCKDGQFNTWCVLCENKKEKTKKQNRQFFLIDVQCPFTLSQSCMAIGRHVLFIYHPVWPFMIKSYIANASIPRVGGVINSHQSYAMHISFAMQVWPPIIIFSRHLHPTHLEIVGEWVRKWAFFVKSM